MDILIITGIFAGIWLITTLTFVVLYKKKQTSSSTDEKSIKQMLDNQKEQNMMLNNMIMQEAVKYLPHSCPPNTTMPISSPQMKNTGINKLVKKIARLKEKKYRERYGEFLVEGAMSVTWALTSSYPVSEVVISAGFTLPESLSALLAERTIIRVPDHLFAKMADTKTPQGSFASVLAKARSP